MIFKKIGNMEYVEVICHYFTFMVNNFGRKAICLAQEDIFRKKS
jgi:hypothetical protein